MNPGLPLGVDVSTPRFPIMRSTVPVSLLLVALLATSLYSNAYAAPDALSSDPAIDDVAPEDPMGPAIDPAVLDALDADEIERMREQARPMIRAWDHTVELEMQQPIPEIESGIGPGSALRISRPDGTFSCTANFIWTDDFDRLYLGTAGHCLLPEDVTATHGPGADYDRNKTRVEVRSGQCPVSALGAACGVGGSGSPWESLGPVTYARYTALGTDFGIIAIPAELEDQVRFEMPMWGGPTQEGSMGLGDSVFHYGQGVAYGEAFASRGRAGIGASSGGSSWEAIGFSNPGDSGSGVVTGGLGGIEGQNAIGILTHGIGVEGAPVPGLFFGTHMDRAKNLVGDHIGLRVWTLPGGQPLPGLEEPEPQDNNETLGPGTVVVRHAHEEETTTGYNYRWSNSWERVRIIVNADSEAGEVRLQVRDENNNTVYSMNTDASYSNDRVITDAPRDIWNLALDFEGHVGSFALRIEEADAETGGSSNGPGGSGGSGGSGSNDADPDGTDESDAPDERPQPLPGPAVALVLLVLGAALWFGRRRSRP